MFKKKRLFLVILLGVLIIMLHSLISQTNIFWILRNYITDPVFRANFGSCESDVFVHYSFFEVIPYVLSDYTWQFDVNMIFSTNLFQVLLPLISIMIGLSFVHYIKTLYSLESYRLKKNNMIYKKIALFSIRNASAFFLAYLILYMLCMFLSKGNLNSTVSRDLFNEILPFNLFQYNPYLFFIIEGLMRILLMPFVYIFFTSTLGFIFADYKKTIFAVILYYFGLSSISFGVSFITDLALYINPTSIMVASSLNNMNTCILLMIACVPLLISILLIKKRLKAYDL